jgi:cell division protein FtsB
MKSSKELIELFNQKEEKSKARILYTIIIPLLLAVGLVSYAIITMKSSNEEKEKLTAKSENLSKENTELKTILNVTNPNIDEAKKTAIKYVEYRNSRSNIISTLLGDTLYRYYREINVLKEYVIKDQKNYWRKYPKENLTVDNDVQLSINEGIVIATLKGHYTKDSINFDEVMEEIKLNNNGKIISIRQFINN